MTKFNPQGSALVYSTYLGGAGDVERAWGIAIDTAGNAYVAGDTKSFDFPTRNALQPWFGGGLSDGFAAALNATGTALGYSTYLGGSLSDEARGVALSSDGRSAYVVGSASSFDFPTTPGVVQPLNAGGLEHHDDAIVVKISNASSLPPTLAVLTVDPSSAAYRQNVTLTATVSVRPASPTPTGTMRFYDGLLLIGSRPLSPSGVATLSKSNFRVGTHALRAEYLGNASAGASTSDVTTLVVSKAATTTTLASSANPARVGSAVTFTAAIAVVLPGGGTPGGIVKFYDGTKVVGTKTLSSGQASLTIAYASGGRRQIEAKYVGNASYLASASPVLAQVIR